MSVKRYDFDCITSDYLLGASLDRAEVADGDYVLHSDYAALLARHNALREAVEWERECAEFDKWANDNCQGSYEWDNVVYCATLEVDRLIATDKE